MKIAYGNYAMPGISPLDAARVMADIGYEGIEIILHPHHESMPDQWSGALRRDVRAFLTDNGMGIPSIFLARGILTDDPATHAKTQKLLRETLTLARDLGMGDAPVVTMDLGGGSVGWTEGREHLLERLLEYAEIAEREEFVLAIEPHYGGLLNSAERALWLMDALDDNPWVRLLYDISHFQLAGDDAMATVASMVPFAAHVHLKEGQQLDEGYEFLLTGAGTLDLPAYFRALSDAGWDGYVTLEVSRMIWSRPEYEALPIAQASYDVVVSAMAEGGVFRG
jgi:inosose dehydratase